LSTPVRLYVYDAVLQRLAQHLQGVAAALGPFIQEEGAVVGPRRPAAVPAHASVCKKCPRLTIYEHERSLLPREPGGVFYKTATARARSGDRVMGDPRLGPRR
jgi:hypothetical protein